MPQSLAPITVLILALSPAVAAAGESLVAYGSGTTGSNGRTPELWANTTPRPGVANLALQVSRGLANAGALPVLSNGTGNLAIGNFTFLLNTGVLLFLPPVVLSSSGDGSVPIPLPNDQSLLGTNLYAQALVLDAALPLGLSATQGLKLRPSRPGVVVAPRSIGGSADPVVEIDLASGTFADFSAGRVDNGQDAAFTKDQSHVFVSAALSRQVVIYDARTRPPTPVTSYNTVGQGRPYFIAMNPDGRRAYVIHQGSSGQAPAAEVIDANPSSPGFGQAFPGPSVPLGTIDAMNMVFSADGNLGYIATLGLFGSARILKVDTNPTSAGYNTVVNTITFPSLTCWAIDIDRYGVFLYAAVGNLTGPMQIAFINAITFQETATPRVTVGRQISNIKLDPRGRILYIAEYGDLGVLDVDQSSPTFGTLTHLGVAGGTTGLAVSDAGDRLYVGQTSGIGVLEFDTTTLTQLRSFAIGNNVTYITFR